MAAVDLCQQLLLLLHPTRVSMLGCGPLSGTVIKKRTAREGGEADANSRGWNRAGGVRPLRFHERGVRAAELLGVSPMN
mgnify:CR=1 FL=1